MTNLECKQLIDKYIAWLRKGLSVEAIGPACELTTPFLDRHNDHVQIYAERRDGKILLSDDGYALADLNAGGLDISTPKRRAALELILNGFGVKLDRDRLQVEASEKNLGQRVHALIQATLAVNDMYVLAQPRVESFFWEDVKAFLDVHDIRYTERVKFSGKTGFDHLVDFVIPRSKKEPERFLQTINNPSKNNVMSFLFSFTDIRPVRQEDIVAYVFLNDETFSPAGDVTEALESYSVVPALWSRRQQFVERLAA